MRIGGLVAPPSKGRRLSWVNRRLSFGGRIESLWSLDEAIETAREVFSSANVFFPSRLAQEQAASVRQGHPTAHGSLNICPCIYMAVPGNERFCPSSSNSGR